MPTEINDVLTELTENTPDALSSALDFLDAELGTNAKPTLDEIAEDIAAREWRERMFATYPMLSATQIYSMCHRRMAKGYFKESKGGNANG